MTELNSEVTASLSVIIISLDTGLFNIDLEGVTTVHSVPVLKQISPPWFNNSLFDVWFGVIPA